MTQQEIQDYILAETEKLKALAEANGVIFLAVASYKELQANTISFSSNEIDTAYLISQSVIHIDNEFYDKDHKFIKAVADTLNKVYAHLTQETTQ
jgi:membrane-bound lytic murein transglycosylase MltF